LVGWNTYSFNPGNQWAPFENLSAMLWKSRIATTRTGEQMASILLAKGLNAPSEI